MTASQHPLPPSVRVETFPGLKIVRTDAKSLKELPVPVGEKPGILLVMLALAGDRGIVRSSIRSLLWPDTSQGNGSNSLRQALFRLRRALGQDAIEDRAGRLYLRLPISLDVMDAAQRLERGDLAGALDIMTTPFGHAMDVAGPALREWFHRYRHQLDQRLEALIRAAWSEHASGAVIAMLQSAVPLVRRLLPTSIDLAWIQLELDARQGEVGAFERHVQDLRALRGGADADPVEAARLNALRQRLTSGAAAPDLRPPSLHPEALRLFERRLADTDEAGGILWLTGPSGIGRTHLLREFAFRASTQGVRPVRIQAEQAPLGLPPSCCQDLAVALSALRGAAGLDPRYGPVIERITRGTLHPVIAESVDALMDLAGAITAEGPIVLLIDDAHRYDTRELNAVLHAVGQHRPRGMLVVVAALPHLVPLRAATSAIALPPLAAAGVRQMIDELARLPQTPWSDVLIDGIRTAGEGIPRRILHLLATLHREGILQERDGHWAAGVTTDELRSRLDDLRVSV